MNLVQNMIAIRENSIKTRKKKSKQKIHFRTCGYSPRSDYLKTNRSSSGAQRWGRDARSEEAKHHSVPHAERTGEGSLFSIFSSVNSFLV
jgi:hypothetical protein